jgi:hypothetical protein
MMLDVKSGSLGFKKTIFYIFPPMNMCQIKSLMWVKKILCLTINFFKAEVNKKKRSVTIK